MRLFVLPLLAAAASLAPGAAAAPATSVETMIEQAAVVEVRWGAAEGKEDMRARMQRYANGDGLMLHGPDLKTPLMALVCGRAALFNVPAPARGGVPERQAAGAHVADRYLAVMGVQAQLAELADRAPPLPAPGARTETAASRAWAYGQERFRLKLQHLPDGGLRLHAVKTGTVTNAAAQADPHAEFSTEADRASNLQALAPVGSWSELVISAQARQPALDAAMSVAGWESMDHRSHATIGEVRTQLGGCSEADAR